MTHVTIIGATGSLGRATTHTLLKSTDAQLTLFSRSASKLGDNPRATKISALVDDAESLENAVKDADVVFVALSGDLPHMAHAVLRAMKAQGTERIVFISSYGIYGEIAGTPEVPSILMPYREAAEAVENSGLDYTIIRPGWFTQGDVDDYKLIPRGETVYGHDISRASIADLVRRIVEVPTFLSHGDVAIVR